MLFLIQTIPYPYRRITDYVSLITYRKKNCFPRTGFFPLCVCARQYIKKAIRPEMPGLPKPR